VTEIDTESIQISDNSILLEQPSTPGSQPFRVMMDKLAGSIANLDCNRSDLYLVFSKAEATFLEGIVTDKQNYQFSLHLVITSDASIVENQKPADSTSLTQKPDQEKDKRDDLTINCDYREISISFSAGSCLKIDLEDGTTTGVLNGMKLSIIKEKHSMFEHKINGHLQANELEVAGKLSVFIKKLEDIVTKIR